MNRKLKDHVGPLASPPLVFCQNALQLPPIFVFRGYNLNMITTLYNTSVDATLMTPLVGTLNILTTLYANSTINTLKVPLKHNQNTPTYKYIYTPHDIEHNTFHHTYCKTSSFPSHGRQIQTVSMPKCDNLIQLLCWNVAINPNKHVGTWQYDPSQCAGLKN